MICCHFQIYLATKTSWIQVLFAKQPNKIRLLLPFLIQSLPFIHPRFFGKQTDYRPIRRIKHQTARCSFIEKHRIERISICIRLQKILIHRSLPNVQTLSSSVIPHNRFNSGLMESHSQSPLSHLSHARLMCCDK